MGLSLRAFIGPEFYSSGNCSDSKQWNLATDFSSWDSSKVKWSMQNTRRKIGWCYHLNCHHWAISTYVNSSARMPFNMVGIQYIVLQNVLVRNGEIKPARRLKCTHGTFESSSKFHYIDYCVQKIPKNVDTLYLSLTRYYYSYLGP